MILLSLHSVEQIYKKITLKKINHFFFLMQKDTPVHKPYLYNGYYGTIQIFSIKFLFV